MGAVELTMYVLQYLEPNEFFSKFSHWVSFSGRLCDPDERVSFAWMTLIFSVSNEVIHSGILCDHTVW